MINILICDDNIYYAKMLMDALNSEDVRVCNIAINGEESLNILKGRDNIDLVLLDIQLPIYNGIEIIAELSRNHIKKYSKSIIVISGYTDLMIRLRNNPVVCKCINKSSSFSDIVKNIEDIITNKKYEKEQKQIEVDIMKQIELLRYNKSYRGTKYLIQSIKLIMENENMDLNNLKKDVYSVIATRNHTTIYNIKNNINKATEQMYYECNHEVLKEYFGFVEDIRPTSKTVIFTIISKIKKEQRKRKK